MSRSRNIKPGFFKNELLVQLPFEQRLLFIGLWTVADRAGRFEDRPAKIKMELFPADDVDVEAGLQALHDNGFILRYSCNGGKYCQVLAWAKHQNPHCKEVESTIPAPCEHSASTMPAPEIPERAGLIPDSGFRIPDSLIPDSDPSPLAEGFDFKNARAREATPEGLHSTQYAVKILEDLELPKDRTNIESFAGAIDALVKGGKSPPAAYEFLTARAKDARELGTTKWTFWIRDGIYNLPENGANHGNGLSRAQERTLRNRRAIVDALRDHVNDRTGNLPSKLAS